MDVGMDPATLTWAAARLAPVQVTLWGHPTTTGLSSIDYFVSSDQYHIHQDSHSHSATSSTYHTSDNSDNRHSMSTSCDVKVGPHNYDDAQDWFSEQLVRLDTLGFYFDRQPALDAVHHALTFSALTYTAYTDTDGTTTTSSLLVKNMLVERPDTFYEAVQLSLPPDQPHLQSQSHHPKKSDDRLEDVMFPLMSLRELIQKKRDDAVVILCPQHLPKFHHNFDDVIFPLLEQHKNAVFVMLAGLEKKRLWRRTLNERWKKRLRRETSPRPPDPVYFFPKNVTCVR